MQRRFWAPVRFEELNLSDNYVGDDGHPEWLECVQHSLLSLEFLFG